MISIKERLSPYNEALGVLPFRKLLIGQGLSMAGDAICLAALPIALIRDGFGGDVFGFIMAAVGVGTVIGALAGGCWRIANRPGRYSSTPIRREALRNWPPLRCW